MVTLVPPDSGPLLGDRPVTVGVYNTEKCKEKLKEAVIANEREMKPKREPKRRLKEEGQRLYTA